MDPLPPAPASTIEVQDRDAIERLASLLRPGQASLIVNLLEDLIRETSYGNVQLVVSDGRVARVKIEKSYKVVNERD
jgi:hypothetical protein